MGHKTEDKIQELMMHVQNCPNCNTVLMENKRQKACPIGFELSIRWLEYASQKGSRDAWDVLQQLKEDGTYRPG